MYDQAAIYHFNPANIPLARIAIRHCKRVMPGLPVVQVSLPEVERIPEVDMKVSMLPEPDAFPRTLFHSYTLTHTIAKEAILLHTDVILLRDIRYLFNHGFDVALPVREPKEMIAIYPEVIYQSGAVMLSRNNQFWEDVSVKFSDMQDWRQGKFDVALHKWLKYAGYKIYGMEGLLHTPDPWNDDWKKTTAAALHYEARRRKAMFMQHWGKNERSAQQA